MHKNSQIGRFPSSNRTAHTLKEKDVKSIVFLKKTRFPKQNAWEKCQQTRPLRRNPRDFWQLGLALLGRAAIPNAWGKCRLSKKKSMSEPKRMGGPLKKRTKPRQIARGPFF